MCEDQFCIDENEFFISDLMIEGHFIEKKRFFEGQIVTCSHLNHCIVVLQRNLGQIGLKVKTRYNNASLFQLY